MDHETALVTGSTDGIGLETAKGLAGRGFTTIIVGRDRERGRRAEQAIRAHGGHDRVYFLAADLSSQDAVRQLAGGVQRLFDRLDVLVNNAGALTKERRETVDSIEWMLAMNHLNPFLLTWLLFPMLEAGGAGRIINVTSNVHRSTRLDLDDVQVERSSKGMQMYGQAKLLNLLTAYELGRRLEGTGVTVNVADPGGADTAMSRHSMGFASRLMTLVGLTRERAARSSIYLATAPEMEGVSGVYIKPNLGRGKSSDASYDRGLAQRAWEVSEQLLKNPAKA